MAKEKEEVAYVTHGHSVMTIMGTAHAGAKITFRILSKDIAEGSKVFKQLLELNLIKAAEVKPAAEKTEGESEGESEDNPEDDSSRKEYGANRKSKKNKTK